jgi:NAD(P)-dependent dehydrogenase (short-subunit alcohol dehydrogenase family)
MTDHLYIVTGASRGLGAAMTAQLMAPGHVLLAIARRNDPQQVERARAQGARLEQWNADLADPACVAARLEGWLGAFDARQVASATLINNAAVLTRVGALEDVAADELATALRVGLEAPLLLAAAFLRATATWPARRRVLNISSGLGRRAMAGQAPSCAVKGGLDHATRAMALDQAQRPNGARVVSLAPGVIDTDMQVHLRAAAPEGFPDKAMFVGLKEGGQLATSADAAARVLAYLDRPDFGSQPIGDVRDA